MSAFDRIIAVVGAVAATIAAYTGIRALVIDRRASRLADERRARDVKPCVRVQNISFAQFQVSSSGGPVRSGFALISDGTGTWWGGAFTIGSHIPLCVFNAGRRRSGCTLAQAEVAAVVGQDVDLLWWDLLAEERITSGPPSEDTSSEEFLDWLLARL